MKIQIIKCKTCGTVIAGCKDEYDDSYWYKQCYKYSKVEYDGNLFKGEINKCCGKKIIIR